MVDSLKEDALDWRRPCCEGGEKDEYWMSTEGWGEWRGVWGDDMVVVVSVCPLSSFFFFSLPLPVLSVLQLWGLSSGSPLALGRGAGLVVRLRDYQQRR